MFVSPWIGLLTSSLVVVDALPSVRTFLGTPSRQLKGRDGPSIQATGPLDHSWIEKYAAIGDSIAAGLGAGHYISATNGVSIPWPGRSEFNADQGETSSWNSTVIATSIRTAIQTS